MIGRDIELEEERLRCSQAKTSGETLEVALAREEAEQMPRLQMKKSNMSLKTLSNKEVQLSELPRNHTDYDIEDDGGEGDDSNTTG